MPNWAENTLIVSGPSEDVKRFAHKAVSKFTPEIIELLDLDATNIFEKAIEGDECDSGEVIDFNNLIPKPADIKNADYTTVGYDWEHEHWGIKWGPCETEILNIHPEWEEISYAFSTAWSPPHEGFITISKKFPTLTFQLTTEEGGCDYYVEMMYEDGEAFTIEESTWSEKHPELCSDEDKQDSE